jgi:Zn finger protein HypA/HybF (possibly regulating hydrogenase expression)
MHEIGVLYKMIEQVEDVAKKNNVKHIKSIEIELGELSGMLPVFFEQYYPIIAQNREMFKDSNLIIREVPGEGLCLDCSTMFNVMRCEGICPKCKSRNKKILSGRDFVLKNILAETNEAENP